MIDLLAPVLPWLAGAAAIIAAVLGAWFGGERSGAAKAERRTLQRDVEAWERADEAGADFRAGGGARQRLRDRRF